jgi:iron(III) transport system ATP-binding protein
LSETATLLQGAVREGHAGKSRNVLAIAWIWLLLAILTFLVIYPVLTLLLGALTDTNPVVEGFSLARLSIANFLTVLANPELVGLSEYADRPVVALSGGQMQRVALARSIVYRPQLLLLDEPLSNLDAKLRLRLRDDLRRILKAAGMTALYVTHDQAEAVVLGDRIGVMREGKLLQMGTPDEIYNRPADLFVANFTGATNELTGTLLERNGAFGVVDIGGGNRVEAALLHGVGTGERVRIALRPENIALGANGSGNAFRARVLDRRYQGTQTVYDIDLAGHHLEVLELGTAARHDIGTDAPVSLPREALWIYRDQGALPEA